MCARIVCGPGRLGGVSAFAVVIALVGFGAARAAPITFVASGVNPESNHSLAASASFELTSATNLRVVLRNTSLQTYGGANGNAVPTDVLTALFFDTNPSLLASNPLVSAVASSIVTGSGGGFTVTNGPINVQHPAVAGGWDYNAPSPQGVGTVGLGIFNLPGGAQLHYGIVNSLYAGNGNGGVTSRDLIRDTVEFDFTVVAGFNLNDIHNVEFQYGTSLSAPRLFGTPPGGGVVPVPGGLVLAATGLLPLGVARWRRQTA
jgi:hypothetical protein